MKTNSKSLTLAVVGMFASQTKAVELGHHDIDAHKEAAEQPTQISADISADFDLDAALAACLCVSTPLENTSFAITGEDGTCAEFEYPADVGTGCYPWDMDMAPFCDGEDAPEWCGMQWCWVQPECMANDT